MAQFTAQITPAFDRNRPPADTKLPIICIDLRDLFEVHTIQDLKALADVELVQAHHAGPPAVPAHHPARTSRPAQTPTESYAKAFSWHSAPIAISMVATAPFTRRAKRDRLQIFSASLYDINHALDRKSIEEGEIKLEDLILADYHDFLPLFSDIA